MNRDQNTASRAMRGFMPAGLGCTLAFAAAMLVPATDAAAQGGCGQNGGVCGFVWNDQNHDGIQDAGEPGLPLVRVFLYDSSDHRDPLPPDYALPGQYGSAGGQDWWSGKGVEYSGSYNRGLSLGSNQSLILNSALNLQLSGDLGDGIRITGAITDNQLPVQAEGNTRQIQEFDRLYIEIGRAHV